MNSKTTPLATTLTATTGALFALQYHADAAVIYSEVQNLTATLGSVTTNLGFKVVNVDGFGGHDFSIQVGGGLSSGLTTGNAALVPAAFPANRVMLNASNGILKLGAGATISAGKPFGGAFVGGVLRNYIDGNLDRGTWAKSEPGFAGIKFVNGSDTHYGWMRLKWTDSADADLNPDTITAIDWAYESIPNTPLQAGDGIPAAVPEAGTALFGLAMAGAAALRRRRVNAGV